MLKRIPLLLAIGFIAGAIFFVIEGDAFSRFWHRLLVVSVPLEKADAIIVLGGEPQARPLEAARLFKVGVATIIFVTGIGDSEANRRSLLEAGVPPSAIIVERNATTTYQNATLLKPLLDRAQIKNALIVTSPFHTRRALATFRKVIPEVKFGIVGASITWWGAKEGQGDVNRFAMIEFLKTIEYWLIYGVSPMLHIP